MYSATKQRISARGWLTRAARALSDLVHENADKVALVEAIADFDKRIDTLDNIQGLIEVELDGDELLTDIEKAADFRDVCRKLRTAAKRLLSDISTTPPATTLIAYRTILRRPRVVPAKRVYPNSNYQPSVAM